jgi:hypothetical protein
MPLKTILRICIVFAVINLIAMLSLNLTDMPDKFSWVPYLLGLNSAIGLTIAGSIFTDDKKQKTQP